MIFDGQNLAIGAFRLFSKELLGRSWVKRGENSIPKQQTTSDTDGDDRASSNIRVRISNRREQHGLEEKAVGCLTKKQLHCNGGAQLSTTATFPDCGKED